MRALSFADTMHTCERASHLLAGAVSRDGYSRDDHEFFERMLAATDPVDRQPALDVLAEREKERAEREKWRQRPLSEQIKRDREAIVIAWHFWNQDGDALECGFFWATGLLCTQN